MSRGLWKPIAVLLYSCFLCSRHVALGPCELPVRSHQFDCGALQDDSGQRDCLDRLLPASQDDLPDSAQERAQNPFDCKAADLATQERVSDPDCETAPCPEPEATSPPLRATQQPRTPSNSLQSTLCNGIYRWPCSLEMQILCQAMQENGTLVPDMWHRLATCNGPQLCPSRPTSAESAVFPKGTPTMAVGSQWNMVEPKCQGTVTSQEKPKERQRREDWFPNRQRPRRSWIRLVATGSLLVCDTSNSASSIRSANERFSPGLSSHTAINQGVGRIATTSKSCQDCAQYFRPVARRSPKSIGTSREQCRERRYSHIQNSSQQHGPVPQRAFASGYPVGSLSYGMEQAFCRAHHTLGSALAGLRGWLSCIREEARRGKTKVGADQSQGHRAPRPDYCTNGGRRARRSNGGGARIGSSHFLNQSQEDEGCYEYSNGYGESDHRRFFTTPKSLPPFASLTDQDSIATGPSLSSTPELPCLDEWDGPTFSPQRENPHASCVAADLMWQALRPCSKHSVAEEPDFKSELEALRQGFLLSQSLLEIRFCDRMQRFEIDSDATSLPMPVTPFDCMTSKENFVQSVQGEHVPLSAVDPLMNEHEFETMTPFEQDLCDISSDAIPSLDLIDHTRSLAGKLAPSSLIVFVHTDTLPDATLFHSAVLSVTELCNRAVLQAFVRQALPSQPTDAFRAFATIPVCRRDGHADWHLFVTQRPISSVPALVKVTDAQKSWFQIVELQHLQTVQDLLDSAFPVELYPRCTKSGCTIMNVNVVKLRTHAK